MSPASTSSSTDPAPKARFATWLYRWRFVTSAVVLGAVALCATLAAQRVLERTGALAELGDTTNGSGAVPPLVFDPTFDVWFGTGDDAVKTYYGIEDRFVAEDYVMVTFEANDHPFGVFGPEALATISRLTSAFLTVPGVRHVRSLTYNPWIRWGTIEDEFGSEEGLLVTDLVEGDPSALTEDELLERMIAVLGAERAAAKVGAERVRAVLGPEVDFADHMGEPLLLGTIVDEAGTTTVLQVQVLRTRIGDEVLEEIGADPGLATVLPSFHSVQRQRAALRGIEHFVRIEQGLAVPTPELAALYAWIAGLPVGPERDALELELRDPTRNFMADASGQLVRKYFEYEADGNGGFVDRSDPANLVTAAGDFEPRGLSARTYRFGGNPNFELNFEEVGLGDGKYVPLMFAVIALLLFIVFRGFIGVAAPLAVVFASVLGMLGFGFARGDLLNNLTMMSPNMLTAVGIADAIHIVAAWAALRSRYEDKQALIIEVLRRNALPVFLTSVTTAVGFTSLTVGKLAPVTMLGYTAGLGTVFAYLLSMTVVPAMLSLVPHGPGRGRRSYLAEAFTVARSEKLVDSILRHRALYLSSSVVVFATAVFGLTRIEIDTDFRGMFPDDNQTMSDFSWIEDRLGGVGDVEIVFAAPEELAGAALSAADEEHLADLRLRAHGAREVPDEFAALSPEERADLDRLAAEERAWNDRRIGVSTAFLTDLDAFERRIRAEMADPESDLAALTDVTSPLDILRKMHQVQHQNAASFYRVPGEGDVPAASRAPRLSFDEWTEEWSLTPAQDGKSLVAQYYLQYENGARPGENLSTQLSADRTHFRMQGRMEQASSELHLAAFTRIEQIARTEFPSLAVNFSDPDAQSAATNGAADMTISGKTLLFARTTKLFSVGFVQSMSLALVIITLVIGVLFRSWRLALISLIPNVLPIIVPLSVFGLFGIALDGPSILVSSVALGVCVDDTIHFFTKFVRAREAGKDARNALVATFHEAGGALTITSIVLILGFSSLLLSDFHPNFQMGALAGWMIGLAWLADFVLTTAVLSYDQSSNAKAGNAADLLTPANRATPRQENHDAVDDDSDGLQDPSSRRHSARSGGAGVHDG